MKLSILVPAKASASFLENSVEKLREHLDSRKQDYEILLIPAAPEDTHDRSFEVAMRISNEKVSVVRRERDEGKGAGLARAVKLAKGLHCILLDADLPFRLEALDQVLNDLEKRDAFIYASRTDSRSRIQVQIRSLHYRMRREQWSRLFSRVVSLLFGIELGDTQAGLKAMPTDFARDAFSRVVTRGFLYDIELFLTARARRLPMVPLPIVQLEPGDSSTVNFAQQRGKARKDLTRILVMYLFGHYNRKTGEQIHWKDFILPAVSLLWMISALGMFIKLLGKAEYSDFDVYYRAAQKTVSHQWSDVYSLTHGPTPYRYSPAILPWLIPLVAFSQKTAQILWFLSSFIISSLGLLILHRLWLTLGGGALWIFGIAILSCIRPHLDAWNWGQVTPWMFFFIAYGLAKEISGERVRAGAAYAIASHLKVGPLIFYWKNLLQEPKKAHRYFFGFFVFTLFSSIMLMSLHPENPLSDDLWTGFLSMIQMDSKYVDPAHYGSQSLTSALLRWSRAGWMTPEHYSGVITWVRIIGLAALSLFWAFFLPKTVRGKGLHFSLGLFAIYWFMPQTFKHAWASFSIPVLFLLTGPLLIFTRITLWGAITVVSILARDFISADLYGWIYQSSIPFLFTLFLGVLCMIEAARESNFYFKRDSK